MGKRIDDLDGEDLPRRDHDQQDWLGRIETLIGLRRCDASTRAFLESLHAQLEERGFLTPKQKASIEQVEARLHG